MTMIEMEKEFVRLFGKGGDVRAFFAPGRVNLIGEHIDYNGGHVFPCALAVGTYAIVRKRKDRKLRFYSENYRKGGIMETSLDDLIFHKENGWINYPVGVVLAFKKKGMEIDAGLDVFVWGNIPGSGLSSSASIEVVMANAIRDFFAFDVSDIDIAILSQQSENGFNGMNCGIMDQFACSMGKKDNAILLNCNDLSYRYVPLVLKGCKIVVTNSRKPHSLAQSHYNDRRKECETALADLQTVCNIKYLCQLTPEEFEKNKNVIKDDTCRLRAKHAVYEEQRTKDAIKALENNDIVSFGRLLNESGDSLRYDYDATCFEIDTLVEEARKQKGVYGSRETGGGWGGNTVSIVEDAFVDSFVENVGKSYTEKTGLKADFAILEVGDGGHRLF